MKTNRDLSRPFPPMRSSGQDVVAEEMVSLMCPSCGLPLYMPAKKLQMPSWQCPSCRKIIRT